MTAAPSRSSWLVAASVAVLLLAHVGLAMFSTAQRSTTVDEIFHVTGGYLFNTLGDYRIHPENGILPQRLHALPAVLMGAKPPPLANNIYWRTSDIHVVSHQFFYESGNDHWPMLLAARAVNVCFPLGICLLVFMWARALGGNAAGFVALSLAVFSPTLLAHGPLATSDAAAALMLTASSGAFWWQLRRVGWRRSAMSAAIFGLACVSKYSAVLLIPVFVVLAGVHVLTCRRGERRVGRIAAGFVLHALAAWLSIWALYGFRYSAFAPDAPPADHFITGWNALLARAGWQGEVIGWLRSIEFLPEAFLYGYTHTYTGTLSRSAFLAGEYSNTGWWWFFPLAFLWKSTLVELLGFGATVVLAGLRWQRLGAWLLRLAPLVALALVYGTAALTSNLNIGHRHLLPLYPALFVVLGLGVTRLKATRRWQVIFVAAQMLSAGLAFPFYIAYFNTIAGGPKNGWRLLVDSSLDWGQDLGGLAAWLRRHNAGPDAQPVFLSYFGSSNPKYYGISAKSMWHANSFKIPMRWYEPTAGIYAISATSLRQVYSPVRGDWNLEWEREYQDLRKFEKHFRELQVDPRQRAELLALVPAEQWERAWLRFEILRFARLSAYLRARGPDELIGYSILIFRLTEAEVNDALHGRYSDWQAAIERAVSRRALAN